ncbi:PIR protein [Plasmodium reichenowi]|uniref:PIR protein n=1 Tax=Plasmodium reichenowi TaxID=5854 RepID=A0A2P9DRV1_PLARE|nr:PIR protein [Plasmodium reichenowi]
MKVHYINILLFALPLNILENSPQKNPSITERHTQNNKLLCECELYSPANYDSDPEMKEVMQQFEDRTTQRFHEYDNRMKTTRQKCKDKCDKESQKIILKDKLEKELTEKLSTLQTDIQSDAIPTCICEKSIADKVEKGCLKCGGILGAAMPELGSIGGTALYTLKEWLIAATGEATDLATQAATKAATQEGVKAVKLAINIWNKDFIYDGVFDLTPIVKESNFNCPTALLERARNLFVKDCITDVVQQRRSVFCNSTIYEGGEKAFNSFTQAGIDAYNVEFALQKEALEKTNLAAVNTAYGGYNTTIIASIVAIVVIVLIMVIIYLILRYRRKKKMKKKLQYIKLLNQ